MADIDIPITGAFIGALTTRDRLLSFGGYGVKKLEVMATNPINIENILVTPPGRVLEFPTIGASLPSAFSITSSEGDGGCSIRVVEYSNQGDPGYFHITGVDDFGKPVYG